MSLDFVVLHAALGGRRWGLRAGIGSLPGVEHPAEARLREGFR